MCKKSHPLRLSFIYTPIHLHTPKHGPPLGGVRARSGSLPPGFLPVHPDYMPPKKRWGSGGHPLAPLNSQRAVWEARTPGPHIGVPPLKFIWQVLSVTFQKWSAQQSLPGAQCMCALKLPPTICTTHSVHNVQGMVFSSNPEVLWQQLRSFGLTPPK